MTMVLASTTPIIIWFVVVVALVGGCASFVLAAVFAYLDFRTANPVREAANELASRAKEKLTAAQDSGQLSPVVPQASMADFSGIAQLAEALSKLNRSGQFLIMALAFIAVAGAAAAAGIAAGTA